MAKEKIEETKTLKKVTDINDIYYNINTGTYTHGELRSAISKLTKNNEEASSLIKKHSSLKEPYYKAIKAYIFSDEIVLKEIVKF